MSDDFRLGDWIVRPALNLVVRANSPQRIQLKSKTMDVLVFLAAHPGQVLSKDRIISCVWEGRFVGDDVLTSAIFQIRKSLNDDAARPEYIQTIRGRGYLLLGPVERMEDAHNDGGEPLTARPDAVLQGNANLPVSPSSGTFVKIGSAAALVALTVALYVLVPYLTEASEPPSPGGQFQGRETAELSASQARRLYREGRKLWLQRNDEAVVRALTAFEEATEIDPSFALAWAGLAEAYWVLPARAGGDRELSKAKALEAATRAFSLNPNLPETLTALGRVSRSAKRNDYLRRALESDPDYSPALSLLGVRLINAGMAREGRSYVRRAQVADPWSPMITFRAAMIEHASGNRGDAISQYRHLATTNPRFNPHETYSGLGLALLETGHLVEAYEIAGKLDGLRGGTRFVDFVRAEFLDLLLEDDLRVAEQFASECFRRGIDDNDLWSLEEAALSYSMLGMADEAFKSLESHCRLGGDAPLFLDVSAIYGPLRKDSERWDHLLDCYSTKDWTALLAHASQ